MTALASPPTELREPIPVEQRLTLGAVDWEDYQAIAKALSGRHVRLTYDRGSLEFMTISGTHGNLSRLFGRLIAVLTEELGLPMRSFGDMTCDNESALRGLEPDECFYLDNEALVREKNDIDLSVDPPPDLAIEIELSKARRNRMGIYAALKVPEVWRFNGQQLTVNQLASDGNYAVTNRSRYFPTIPVGEVVRFIEMRTRMDENSLLRSFREWVRSQIAS
ncbi:MAG TPA: Uma2 family endonuclease [Planctomycetaceae bacterium]|nr:Uma2 family endonuclease [Planctomycetaceae bacterium]